MATLAVMLLLGMQGPDTPDPRRTVREAFAAVQGDSVARVRERWAAVGSGTPGGAAAALGLATLARLSYDYVAARAGYARLLALPRPNLVSVYARIGLSEADRIQRSLDSAAAGFTLAAREAETLADRPAQTEALIGLGLTISRLEPLDAALAILERARRTLPANQPDLAARLLCTRALLLVAAGRPGARVEANAGLAAAVRAGDLRLQGLCWQALGSWTLINIDDPAASAAPFDSAEACQRRARDLGGLAETLVWSGWDHLSFFNNGPAKTDFLAALAAARESGSRVTEAWAARMLGQLAVRTGAFPEAATQLARAAAIARQLGDRRERVHIARIQGSLELGMGRIAEAERTFGTALPDADRLSDAVARTAIRQGIMWATGARGDWTGAQAQLDSILRFMRRYGLEGLLPGLRYTEGVVALRVGDLDYAAAMFEWYLRSSSASEYVGRYQSRSRLAEIHLRRGAVDRAVAELTAASEHLDSLRAALSDAELRTLAFQTGGSKNEEADYGFATLIAGFVRAGRVAPAFQLAERRRARELADRLLRASAEPNSATSRPVFPLLSSGDTTGLRPPDDSTALLEYVAGRRGQPSTLFALIGTQLSGYVLPSLDSLAPRVERFLGVLHAGGDVIPQGRRLRAALLDSVLLRLPQHVRRLLVVPDDLLHRLPFDALAFDDGAPLLSRYAVAVVPSARIAATLHARRRPLLPRELLAFGDPAFASPPVPAPSDASEYQEAFAQSGGLPRLPQSGREARTAGRFARRATVRLGAAASEASLKQASRAELGILHFATHALVDDWMPERAALALAPGLGEDGFLGAAEILALDLPVDLVVLSACRTASGPVVGGEGVQGLTAPLLAAGAHAVVATHWPIGDRATLPLVRRFYAALADGQPVSEALRTAKLAALRNNTPVREWAAFVAVGDPLQRVALEPRAGTPVGWIGVLAAVCAVALGALLWRRARQV